MSRHHGPRQLWSDDDIAWLVTLWPDVKSALVAEALGRRLAPCYGMAIKLGLKKRRIPRPAPTPAELRRDGNPGIAYRFKPGIVPWNTGMKGWKAGERSAETRAGKATAARALAVYQPRTRRRTLQQGRLPAAQGGRRLPAAAALGRRCDHCLGRTPRTRAEEGHRVYFINGDKRDIRIENLALISDADNMRRNSLHNQPREIRQIIQLRGALNRKINARSKTA